MQKFIFDFLGGATGPLETHSTINETRDSTGDYCTQELGQCCEKELMQKISRSLCVSEKGEDGKKPTKLDQFRETLVINIKPFSQAFVQ
ncbi:hypothetical protein KIN20_017094 [Parelaphostrongylus tenuis]|uniref:Uncharacterized protein n=1 Tax=Parelaphostrongylus tenuis TaxID=148309 RepID=A0AAD5N610_PARTN|nr:hypothetical protein KIN20_017094 [Parelaphostrongylus tenuis]